MAVTRQRPINSNRGMMVSMQSMLRCYKHKLGAAVRELLGFSCCCEKLAAEVGDSSGTQRKGNIRH
jgi:hypothetical protein